MKKFTVTLKSAGNPDYGQNPDEPISPEQQVEVYYLEEASRVCRKYIEEWNLGGGNWIGGQVVTEEGKQIARIAYNGRIIYEGSE